MQTLLVEMLVILAFGALSIADGIRLVLRQGLQTYDELGPGFYNVGIGALLVLVGLIYLLSKRKKLSGVAEKPAVGRSKGNRAFKMTMLGMIGVMVLYIVLIDVIGYLLASLVFFFLITRTVGFRSWFANIGISLLMTVSFYLVFVTWLGIIFPRGALIDF